MLLGYKLSHLMERPNLYPCVNNGSNDRYYIANEETKGGSHKGVKGYRNLTQEERNEWADKIKPIKKLSALQELLLVG